MHANVSQNNVRNVYVRIYARAVAATRSLASFMRVVWCVNEARTRCKNARRSSPSEQRVMQARIPGVRISDRLIDAKHNGALKTRDRTMQDRPVSDHIATLCNNPAGSWHKHDCRQMRRAYDVERTYERWLQNVLNMR